MPPRVRRLLFAASLLALLAGCVHRPAAPTLTSSAASQTESAPSASRITPPGTAFTRNQPASPFTPRLVVTSQVAHQDIFARSNGNSPGYFAAETLRRGQRVYCLPFAINYGMAPDGRSDLTFALSVYKPDGTMDGVPLSGVLWQDQVAGPDRVLYPATTMLFEVEPDDPAGDYVIVARVTDHLAGETVELRHSLRVADYVPPPAPVDFDPRRWFDGYHLAPTPELALPALPILFSAIPADQRTATLPSLLGFYDQVLTDNPWLLPAFCTRLSACEPNEAYALSLVLGHHLRHASEPPAGVSFAAWVRLTDFRTYAWPGDADAPLARAAQLDTLWGRFFASGLYSPVADMLALLTHHADLGAADQWQTQRAAAGAVVDLSAAALAEPAGPDDSPDAPPADVRRDVLLRNTLWSLRNNARQHPLLRGYLDWTLRNGVLPEAERGLLLRILNSDTNTASAAPEASPL
jgi:hypothetical protein